MDLTIVAPGVVGLLIWFVTKTGEGFAQKAGEEVFDFLKIRFKNDKEAKSTLSYFSKKPDRYKGVLADIIKEKAATDHEFGEKLWALFEQNREIILAGDRIMQNAEGDGIAQALGTQASASVSVYKPEWAKGDKKNKGKVA